MVDAGLNVAAEQVIEASRLRRAPGPCRQPWAQRRRRRTSTGPQPRRRRPRRLMGRHRGGDRRAVGLPPSCPGRPGMGGRSGLADPAGRRDAHDRIDDHSCRSGAGPGRPTTSCELLWDAGVPIAKVVQPHRQPELAQFDVAWLLRGAGPPGHRALSLQHAADAVLTSAGPVHQRHAPLLGEHNEQLLRELGLTRSEIDALETDGIIGDALLQST